MRFILFILLTWCIPAFAFDAQPARYVQPELVSPELLPPPAKERTAEWNKQLAMVAAAQKHISREDKIAMTDEQHVSIAMVSHVLGDDFNETRFPKTFALLQQVFNDTGIVVEATKTYWGTRRPYVAAPKQIKLMIEPVKNNAYPSGHTCLSHILAEVLGMLLPEKRAILREQASAVARRRIEAGVHYPQDIEGGKKLGSIMLGAIVQNDAFQDDLNAAKEEMNNYGK